jgi:ubiquinone biosynthesis monooxygenase Coq6
MITLRANSTTPANSPEYYDIVVVGGGMVGTAMAKALANEKLFKNKKIALIESQPEPKEFKLPEIHSNQVCALNDQTVNLLKSLDSWDFIEKTRHYGRVHNMHVWDGSSDASISFRNEDGSNLALVVENDLIQASLNRGLKQSDNLKILYSSKVKDLKQNFQNVELELNDQTGTRINAKLVIGSDGANSFIRKKVNFSVMKWDYDQVAIVATLKLSEKSENFTAWQRFLSTGPIALLPLNNEYSTLVWSLKKSLVKELLDLNSEQFVHRVNEAFVTEETKNQFANDLEETLNNGFDLLRESIPDAKKYIVDRNQVPRLLPPRIGDASVRGSFPLSFLHSNNYVSQRVAMIGDAVHRVHPLAGQGVNLGFGDICCLMNALRDNTLTGTDIGSEIYLKQYQSQRQREAYVKVLGIDFLNKLYTDQSYAAPLKIPLVALRTLGLTMSNRILPLKDIFIKQAMK